MSIGGRRCRRLCIAVLHTDSRLAVDNHCDLSTSLTSKPYSRYARYHIIEDVSFPHCSYQTPLVLTPLRLRGIVSFGCISEATGRQGTGMRGKAWDMMSVR